MTIFTYRGIESAGMNGMEHSCRLRDFFFSSSSSENLNLKGEIHCSIKKYIHIWSKIYGEQIKEKVYINIRYNSIQLIFFFWKKFRQKIFFNRIGSCRYEITLEWLIENYKAFIGNVYIPRIRYGAWWFQLCSQRKKKKKKWPQTGETRSDRCNYGLWSGYPFTRKKISSYILYTRYTKNIEWL